jgi:hypothetical protein
LPEAVNQVHQFGVIDLADCLDVEYPRALIDMEREWHLDLYPNFMIA